MLVDGADEGEVLVSPPTSELEDAELGVVGDVRRSVPKVAGVVDVDVGLSWVENYRTVIVESALDGLDDEPGGDEVFGAVGVIWCSDYDGGDVDPSLAASLAAWIAAIRPAM